tara:strand:- start:80 stop:991 length:912 start_codon:yes stop_codon:yes gene_type:complete
MKTFDILDKLPPSQPKDWLRDNIEKVKIVNDELTNNFPFTDEYSLPDLTSQDLLSGFYPSEIGKYYYYEKKYEEAYDYLLLAGNIAINARDKINNFYTHEKELAKQKFFTLNKNDQTEIRRGLIYNSSTLENIVNVDDIDSWYVEDVFRELLESGIKYIGCYALLLLCDIIVQRRIEGWLRPPDTYANDRLKLILLINGFREYEEEIFFPEGEINTHYHLWKSNFKDCSEDNIFYSTNYDKEFLPSLLIQRILSNRNISHALSLKSKLLDDNSYAPKCSNLKNIRKEYEKLAKIWKPKKSKFF